MTNGTKLRKAAIGAVCALLLTCLIVPAASAGQDSGSSTSKTSHKTKSLSSSSKKRSSRKKKSSRVRGQEKIDSERAQQIQEALIRAHYLNGDATGTWNQASEDAMRKYQADHGWQSKTVPDSRALISLGLGPSKDHLLNPESAMTTVPSAPKSQFLAPTTQSTQAVANPETPSSPAAAGTPASTDPSGPQKR
jgi:putative peptidoglycan binding protein